MSVAADTSLLVPSLVTWHPRRDETRELVRSRVTAVPAHALVETFSVLTRLPAPYRIAPALAAGAIERLALKLLVLPGGAHRQLLVRLAGNGISGGATYDGLVAATAAHHGATLLSLDRRARATYDALGVRYEMI